MLTDTHCHLGSERFSPDEIPELIAKATDMGVTRLVTLATDEGDQQRNLKLAQDHPEVYACLGIHPCDVHETRDDFESLVEPFLADKKVCAVGETGLDYFHPAPDGWEEDAYHERQKDFLRRHFAMAKKAGLNIVIHTRDRKGHQSFEDCLAIYAEFYQEVRAVFHCFPGPPELAQRVIDLGGLVSFTGIVTFKNAEPVVKTALVVPPESFMIETDAPFLAPIPVRGQRCEPSFTRHTAQKIADLRGIALEDLATKTNQNAEAFFRF